MFYVSRQYARIPLHRAHCTPLLPTLALTSPRFCRFSVQASMQFDETATQDEPLHWLAHQNGNIKAFSIPVIAEWLYWISHILIPELVFTLARVLLHSSNSQPNLSYISLASGMSLYFIYRHSPSRIPIIKPYLHLIEPSKFFLSELPPHSHLSRHPISWTNVIY